MFDAKSLIEMMLRGAVPQAQQPAQGAPGGMGSLGDLLGKALGGGGQAPASGQGGGLGGLGDLLGKALGGGQAGQATGGQGGAPAPSLEDMLRKLMPANQGAAPDPRAQRPAASQAAAPDDGGGSLGDLLGKVLGGAGGAGGAGGIADILKQVLGQATSGVQEGARKLDDATGASGRARDAIGQATGQSPDEMIAKLKELLQQHQMGAGAAAAGLGGLVLGTKSGRALAGRAIKLGGLALIGGLAYKALQNYQAGKPIIAGSEDVVPAPHGSGFEAAAVTNESAMLYLKGMVAAAAADGRIDEKEHAKIIGGLKQAGAGEQAEEFLAQLLNNPPTIDQLVGDVQSQEQAVQLYTAARVAIDLHAREEQVFLATLASKLGVDDELAAHIDAAARAAA